MINRYFLKSVVIGFKVPNMDLGSFIGTEEFAKGVIDSYEAWFDVIDSEIPLLEIENESYVMLYRAILRIDSAIMTEFEINEGLSNLKMKVRSHFNQLFEKNHQSYEEIPLESISVGLESPLFTDELATELQSEIQSKITIPYFRNELHILSLPNLNYALIHDIIIDSVNLHSATKLMQDSLNSMEEIIKNKGIINLKFK